MPVQARKKSLGAAAIIALTCLLATPALACWTPLEWQTKPVQWSRDQDQNGLDDTLDQLIVEDAEARAKAVAREPAPAPITAPIVVNLTRCPQQADVDWLADYGTIVKMGRFVTFVAMDDVAVSDLPTIAQNPLVAFVEQMFGFGGTLDVSGAAIKVRNSAVYPNNIEALAPWIDGTGTTVAIIDSGVDDQAGGGVTHESFPASKFVGGFIVGSGLGNPNDTNGHGTHVAGIAIGTGGTAGTFRGMAPAAQLVDCQTTLMCGPPSWLDVITCFEQIWLNQSTWQVDVANLSLRQCTSGGATITTNGTDAASQLANFLVAQGITIVAAAGNDGPSNTGLTSPCAADNAICVAAMDDQSTVTRTDDAIAFFSSRGPRASDGDLDTVDEQKPEITAPGGDAFADQIRSAQANTVSGYVNLSGTSMASPHVAGVAALIKQVNPGINPGSIKNLIIQTAEDFGTAGWDTTYGNGYIDAYAAVAATTNADPGYPGAGTYPQPWLCTDITTATPPTVGVPNTVTVSVTNNSSTAAQNVEITFGVYIFSTGTPVFYSIGSQTLNVPGNGTVSVSHPWTPQPSPSGNPHACLKSTVNYGFDTNFSNNTCQRNITINQTGSPANFTFTVQNTLKEAVTVNLVPAPQTEFPEALEGTEDYLMLPGERVFAFDRWTTDLDQTTLDLGETDCPVDVELTLTVVPDATPTDGGLYSLPAMATTAKGDVVELGGITAYGHTPCPDSWGGDDDGDSVCGVFDNCGEMLNPEQLDADGDGLGDICDPTPNGPGPEPCVIGGVEHAYYATYECLDEARTENLKRVMDAERVRAGFKAGNAVAGEVAKVDVLEGILDGAIFRAQVDYCKVKATVAQARLEATQYNLEIFEGIGEISKEGAAEIKASLDACAAH